MGIYRAYGVEYGALYTDGTYHVLIPLKDFDDRLVQSQYYLNRKDVYICKPNEWRERVHEIDIDLVEAERQLVNRFVAGSNVLEHGFYDVCYVDNTY